MTFLHGREPAIVILASPVLLRMSNFEDALKLRNLEHHAGLVGGKVT